MLGNIKIPYHPVRKIHWKQICFTTCLDCTARSSRILWIVFFHCEPSIRSSCRLTGRHRMILEYSHRLHQGSQRLFLGYSTDHLLLVLFLHPLLPISPFCSGYILGIHPYWFGRLYSCPSRQTLFAHLTLSKVDQLHLFRPSTFWLAQSWGCHLFLHHIYRKLVLRLFELWFEILNYLKDFIQLNLS